MTYNIVLIHLTIRRKLRINILAKFFDLRFGQRAFNDVTCFSWYIPWSQVLAIVGEGGGWGITWALKKRRGELAPRNEGSFRYLKPAAHGSYFKGGTGYSYLLTQAIAHRGFYRVFYLTTFCLICEKRLHWALYSVKSTGTRWANGWANGHE